MTPAAHLNRERRTALARVHTESLLRSRLGPYIRREGREITPCLVPDELIVQPPPVELVGRPFLPKRRWRPQFP